jgi:hypothetical protein
MALVELSGRGKLMKKPNNYKLNTYANGFGVWQCAITYPYPGLGNSYEALKIMELSHASARRSIRRAIQERSATKVGRLSYRVTANDLDAMNRLHGLTIQEGGN